MPGTNHEPIVARWCWCASRWRPQVTRLAGPALSGCAPPLAGERGDEVGENERTHADEEHRQDRHGGVGYGVDVAGEQGPELASDDDAERYPHDDADDCGDRRLPGDRGCQLSLGEAERFQQGQVPPAPADRRGEGEAKSDDRPARRARQRGRPGSSRCCGSSRSARDAGRRGRRRCCRRRWGRRRRPCSLRRRSVACRLGRPRR